MPDTIKFLIIDDNPDSRFLLTKTLLRKFPTAILVECADGGAAMNVASNQALSAIIVHRSGDAPGLDLVAMLRGVVLAKVPIVMVSGIDRSIAAAEAGADYFLHYDEWLRIGTVVAGLITFKQPGSAQPFATGEPDATLSNV